MADALVLPTGATSTMQPAAPWQSYDAAHLQPCMAVEVEVKLHGVADLPVHHGPRQHVALLLVVGIREQACVVALLHDHKGNGRAVAGLKLLTRL